jgi:hypothetical protein
MGAVVHPVAGGRNPLASRNRGGMANDGHQVPMAARLDPDDAEAVLGILVGDALNQTGQHLPIGWFLFRLHFLRDIPSFTPSLIAF